MDFEVADDVAKTDEGGIFGIGENFETELALGLEAAEFGEAFHVETISLIAGTVDGGLGGVGVVAVVEVGFDYAATAETPGSGDDFDGEGVFDGAFGARVGRGRLR